MGGLDPDGCAAAVSEVADRLGLTPKIAYVSGDDVLPRLTELIESGNALAHLDTGEPIGPSHGSSPQTCTWAVGASSKRSPRAPIS